MSDLTRRQAFSLAALAGGAAVAGGGGACCWAANRRRIGPCLRLAPGDRVDLTVRNDVTVPINTHFHEDMGMMSVFRIVAKGGGGDGSGGGHEHGQ